MGFSGRCQIAARRGNPAVDAPCRAELPVPGNVPGVPGPLGSGARGAGRLRPGGQLPASLGAWRADGWRLEALGLAFPQRHGEPSSAREERWGGGAQALPCRGMGARQEKSFSIARSESRERVGLRALPGSPLTSREGKKTFFSLPFFLYTVLH